MHIFDIDRSGGAAGRAVIDIDAPLGRVWDRLTRLSDWPVWNDAVTRMEVAGPVAPGTTFRWTAGGLPIRSRIEALEPGRTIGWTGTAPLIRARHLYRLSERVGGTRVETEESFAGPLARLAPSLCARMITASLEQGLGALKRSCEAGTGTPAGRPARYGDGAAQPVRAPRSAG